MAIAQPRRWPLFACQNGPFAHCHRQIAEELYQSGRKVYLSIGSAGRVPRRYRGRDINDWFTNMGMFDTEVGDLKSPRAKFAPHPQISGKNGGESLNLHQFAVMESPCWDTFAALRAAA